MFKTHAAFADGSFEERYIPAPNWHAAMEQAGLSREDVRRVSARPLAGFAPVVLHNDALQQAVDRIPPTPPKGGSRAWVVQPEGDTTRPAPLNWVSDEELVARMEEDGTTVIEKRPTPESLRWPRRGLIVMFVMSVVLFAAPLWIPLVMEAFR